MLYMACILVTIDVTNKELCFIMLESVFIMIFPCG